MKATIALIGLLALSAIALFGTQNFNQDTEELKYVQMYEQWKNEFGTQYLYGSTLDIYRLTAFIENAEKIEQYNKEHPEVVLKLNQFAAMTAEEFKSQMLLRTRPEREQTAQTYKSTRKTDLPSSINWSDKGAIYKTQNQGSCGSCWAFATIGGLQGLRFINDGVLELLSAQQITSCVAAEYLDDKTQGCGGGEARYAYQYTAENGIETWNDYPYVNGSGGVAAPCNYEEKKVVFYNQGVGYVPALDVQAMKENLFNQPLTIAVDASALVFQFYSQGVISANCGTDLNHAILLVGYNETASTPYWIVQNSWGTSWGQSGFGNIAITEGKGVCGINMQVDYPTKVNSSQQKIFQ